MLARDGTPASDGAAGLASADTVDAALASGTADVDASSELRLAATAACCRARNAFAFSCRSSAVSGLSCDKIPLVGGDASVEGASSECSEPSFVGGALAMLCSLSALFLPFSVMAGVVQVYKCSDER
ncbi:hypothetical protein SYNPS1DRAFT_26553 [Syncephalis pseudoplumigaleata]|uniref:Uncharacterized protein n=1 Tax=Syncephalis pseudoplumigaleata TaxID=1712513 RepID=A0A4P9Z7C8_9FUNG|nr:hypothetical protein SYNPS1DRAFT_26553 [Syncephalis pseudoplumigaleata]|eukprot:RKP27801.1 hypothetical protein SYNPS1DRAFT_26553 [Syncephalis pseudoplumigaleata]